MTFLAPEFIPELKFSMTFELENSLLDYCFDDIWASDPTAELTFSETFEFDNSLLN